MERDELLKLFVVMIDKIGDRVPLHAFIVFGSRAKGSYFEHSDYDLLIIADFIGKYLKRTEWVVETAPLLPIDVFCYTPEEFDKMFNTYHVTAIDSVDEGIILKGENYIKRYQEKLDDFKRRGMKKTKAAIHPPIK